MKLRLDESWIVEKYHNSINKIDNFFHKIKRVLIGIPMLWREDDWSWEYCLNTLAWKLDRLRSSIDSSYFQHVGAEKQMRDITICVELIKRLNDNDYSSPLQEKLSEEHWQKGFEWKDVPGHPDLSELIDGNVSPSKDRVYMNEILMSEKRKQEEYQLLFKILNKRMQHWWT